MESAPVTPQDLRRDPPDTSQRSLLLVIDQERGALAMRRSTLVTRVFSVLCLVMASHRQA